MFILKTSLSLLLFFVFIIYFTIRKVNPLCEKIIYTRKKVGGRPTSPAESRTSLSGLYTFTPSGHEIRHKRLTRFCASQSSFTYHALRVHHISGGPPFGTAPTNHKLIPHSPRATNYEPQKSTDGRPTSPAESRTSLSGLYTFTPSGHEIRHKRLTRFCASQSSFTYHALCVHHISGGPPFGTAPTSHEPRTTNNKKSTGIFQCFFYKNQRLPILPGGLPPSTFGVCGLNCCVRHGNRWIPAAIATELLGCSGVGQVRRKRFTQFCVSSPTPSKLVLCLSYPDNCIKMFFLTN